MMFRNNPQSDSNWLTRLQYQQQKTKRTLESKNDSVGHVSSD